MDRRVRQTIGAVLVAAGLGLAAPAVVTGQVTAGPGWRLGWDVEAPTVEAAASYVYTYRLDGGPGVVMPGVTCAGTVSPFLCQALWPPMTPGAHGLTLTAGNAAGTSAESEVFRFEFLIVPAVPRGLRNLGPAQ